jgi:hypothetical protein
VAVQTAKLDTFRKTFGLSDYFSKKILEPYLLLFLSADHSDFLSGVSPRQLSWLRHELAEHRKKPTIIFFHGPLRNTLRTYRGFINTPNFIAQPHEELDVILKENPQIFLWVSGHTHTSPWEESYAHPVNLYGGRVTNIHNKDMNRGTIWTNSLFLYPDRVEVKTYNHMDATWVPYLERTIGWQK